ncbi:MAG: dihydroorotase [Bacteroidetes bacterium]|nr:dihydroorotase [Bacteroidota bacterium]
MSTLIFKNVHVVNEGNIEVNDVLIKNNHFEKVAPTIDVKEKAVEIDGTGMHLMPGLIDDQVHFREPGLTHKASIYTEAKAAVAGGVTSFMEMPNVKPPTLTHALLEEKYLIGQHHSVANYSFFMGSSKDNIEEEVKINRNKKELCGLKIFMGSSTGNMLVDNIITLEKIFAESEVLIATHCEQENIISQHIEQLKAQHVDYNHVSFHPIIRDVEACYESSLSAIQLAKKHHTRLHILHISTEKELQLFTNLFPLKDKRITAEVCVHHLHFTADDYAQYGNLIKCNPAIKAKENREALWQALLDDRLDIIATDHAPHTWDEKQQDYVSAPAGVPLVQHSLYLLLEAYKAGKISLEKIVEKACHAPAICFEIEKRGYIREGYFADAVLVNLNEKYTVTKENILYKCGWSPFEGHTFPALIHKTIVNGHVVYDQGVINEQSKGMRLRFDRN